MNLFHTNKNVNSKENMMRYKVKGNQKNKYQPSNPTSVGSIFMVNAVIFDTFFS